MDEMYSIKTTIRDALASDDITYIKLCLEIIKELIKFQEFKYPNPCVDTLDQNTV
jgi:hypothetical protein